MRSAYFYVPLYLAVSVGIIISLAIFLGAGAISEHMMKAPFSVYALKVLSPGAFDRCCYGLF